LTCTDRQNWKENVKNNKKIKKTNNKPRNFEIKTISHTHTHTHTYIYIYIYIYIYLYIFFVKELLEISRIRW